MHFGAVLYIMGKFRLLPHCAMEEQIIQFGYSIVLSIGLSIVLSPEIG